MRRSISLVSSCRDGSFPCLSPFSPPTCLVELDLNRTCLELHPPTTNNLSGTVLDVVNRCHPQPAPEVVTILTYHRQLTFSHNVLHWSGYSWPHAVSCTTPYPLPINVADTSQPLPPKHEKRALGKESRSSHLQQKDKCLYHHGGVTLMVGFALLQAGLRKSTLHRSLSKGHHPPPSGYSHLSTVSCSHHHPKGTVER